MSYAVMPLADYKNFCDAVREHTPYLNGNLIDGEAFEEVVINGDTYLASKPIYLVAGKEYVLDFPNDRQFPFLFIEKAGWSGVLEPTYIPSLPYSFTPTETAEYRVYSIRNIWGNFVDTTDATLVCTKNYESIKSADMVDGINDVLDAGKKAEYDAFWDAYQENGSKQGYLYAFSGRGWNDDTFKPKHPLTGITNGNSMFAYSGVKNIDCEIEIVVTSDSVRSMFASAWVERIKLLKVNESLSYTGSFSGCSKLQDIRIGGVIGKTVSFSESPLNYESILSIIEHLSSTSTGQKLTLKKSAVDTAFETSKGAADGSTNPDSYWVSVLTWKPNWTITLA